jgi:cell division protein FtsB
VAAKAELAELRRENATLREDNNRLRGMLSRDAARQKELDQLREERDRLVSRVRVLQSQRDSGKTTTAATAATAAAAAPARAATKRPTVWEHNRAQPAIKRGEPAGVWCPMCRAAGADVELVRYLGRFARVSDAASYESVACPRCLFTALRRKD